MLARLALPLVSLLLASHLVGCDKKVIKEQVKPAQAGGGAGGPSRPLPDLDGSVIIDELPDMDAGADAGDEPSADASVETSEFTKARLLAAIADCALSSIEAFAQRADELADATSAWAEDPTSESAARARAAFRAAMESFQRVEAFRFGPLAPPAEPGGRSLRDQVYAYPHSNLCKVDQQIVDQAYQRGDFSSSVTTGRGLGALEYLEYYIGAQNACAPTITINAQGSWAALSADELARRRIDYAAAVARDIQRHAHEIVTAYAPGGDDFLSQLTSAGRGSDVYASEQAALNAVSNALFYVEIEVKDYKLALPLGISPDCTSGSTCPESLESPFARISTSNIAANLAAFRSIFQGCQSGYAGLGFDDWLIAVGEQELADSMLAALDGVQHAVQTLDPPLEQALAQDPGKVRAVYDALKALTDQLKSRFVGVLDLELPRVAEGDND